jgi:hypothetical protein
LGEGHYVSKLSSLIPGVRTLRYVLVAVIAFSLGGAAVAQAVAPSGILGTIRIADAANDTQLAKVDPAGNLQVKVTSAAATEVSGTVSVSNFPATQNVNVTAGTVLTRPAVATRRIETSLLMDASESDFENFTTAINASFIMISTDDDMSVFINGSIGEVLLLEGSGHREMSFTERVPVDHIRGVCHNAVFQCFVDVSIIGD